MPRIETAPANFQLADDDLCLSRNGWLHELVELTVQLEGGMPLEDALKHIWEQQKGLLGEGTLIFFCVARAPMPRGYVVFRPRPLKPEELN